MPVEVSQSDVAQRHQCLIYSGHASQQLSSVIPLLISGLRNNYRCLVLGDEAALDMIRNALSAQDIDVPRKIAAGALILSSDRGHLEKAGFQPRAMIDGLTDMIDAAVRDGFQGLCATGDILWELGAETNVERLLEYEALLEQVFFKKPLMGICQYNLDTLPNRAVRDALATHQTVYLGNGRSSKNVFYVPPELLLENPPAAVRDQQGAWMWQQINQLSRAEHERDQALDHLAQINQDLERRVHERTAELEMSNRELEAFCYSISHDLRTPLRAIDGFSRLILERDYERLDAEGKSDFTRVRAASQRMSELIEGLLNLSRITRCDIRREPVDLSQLARAIVQELSAGDPERRVRVDIEPGLKAVGDPGLLSSALGNLLGNAWKFTARKEDARITFSAVQEEGRTVYVVRDNGAGFNMAYKDKLFTAFQRLHSPGDYPGNGIGLATVQRIIHRHHGRLWAEGQPDAGAAFYFTL